MKKIISNYKKEQTIAETMTYEDYLSLELAIDAKKDKWLNINIKDILMYGETDEVSTRALSTIIPGVELKHNLGDGNYKMYPAYKCFVNEKHPYKEGTVIHHEDRLSSWNCLLQAMKMPQYLIIYKKQK